MSGMGNGKPTSADVSPEALPGQVAELIARVENNVRLTEKQSIAIEEVKASLAQLQTTVKATVDAQGILAQSIDRLGDQVVELMKLVTDTTKRVSNRDSTNDQLVLDAARAHLLVQQAAKEQGLSVQKSEAEERKDARAARRKVILQAVPSVLSLIAFLVTGYLAARGLIAPATPHPPTITIERGPTP